VKEARLRGFWFFTYLETPINIAIGELLGSGPEKTSFLTGELSNICK
jgi:hypothetical protein